MQFLNLSLRYPFARHVSGRSFRAPRAPASQQPRIIRHEKQGRLALLGSPAWCRTRGASSGRVRSSPSGPGRSSSSTTLPTGSSRRWRSRGTCTTWRTGATRSSSGRGLPLPGAALRRDPRHRPPADRGCGAQAARASGFMDARNSVPPGEFHLLPLRFYRALPPVF